MKSEQVKTEVTDGKVIETTTGTWEAVTKDAEGNAHIHTLHKRSEKVLPAIDIEEIGRLLVRQAPPVIINATKRKAPTRDAKVEVFFGDTHHPVQDKKKLALAQLALRELQPDGVTFCGDDLDMALFSRFETRQEWSNSTQDGIDQFSETLAQTRANIGKAAMLTVIEGNHNMRLAREVRKYNQGLLGIRRANEASGLGALSIEHLLRIDELENTQYISGYPSADYWYQDNFKAYHGRALNSTGSTVAKELRTETVNFVHGHTHKAGIVYKTLQIGRATTTIFGMEVGTFADHSLVPSGQYSTTERGFVLPQSHDWQCALGVVYYNEDRVVPYLLPITDEGIDIFGKVYKS